MTYNTYTTVINTTCMHTRKITPPSNFRVHVHVCYLDQVEIWSVHPAAAPRWSGYFWDWSSKPFPLPSCAQTTPLSGSQGTPCPTRKGANKYNGSTQNYRFLLGCTIKFLFPPTLGGCCGGRCGGAIMPPISGRNPRGGGPRGDLNGGGNGSWGRPSSSGSRGTKPGPVDR